MKISTEVSSRIAMLRIIMIVGVVYVHAAANDRIIGMGSGFFDYFAGFFNYAAFRVPVPLLAMVSGYLIFAADLDRRPVELWRKKAKTVGLPFLFFNFLAIALFFSLQHVFPDAIMRVDLMEAGRYDWINAMFGVRDAPFNYPLYFIRDLLVLIVLAPIFGMFIRRTPLLGLAIVIAIFYVNFDSYLIIRSTSAIMFYIGGMLAVKKVDLLKLDAYAAPMLALFVAICLGIVLFRNENINYAAMTGPFLVWPAFKYLSNTEIGQWIERSSKYSLFLFAAHAPLLQILRLVYAESWLSNISPNLFWLVAPTLVVVILKLVYDRAIKAAPVFFSLITGGRTASRTPKFVERRSVPRPANAPVYSADFRFAMEKP